MFCFTESMPNRCTSPSAISASTLSTQRRVMPYLQAFGPPAFVASEPPKLHSGQEFGSGGYQSPCASACSFTAASPALAGADSVRFAVFTAMAPGQSERSTTMLRALGTQPPALPLPAPRGTRVKPSSPARRTSSRSASRPRGFTTASGSGPRTCDSSWRKAAVCAGSRSTRVSGRASSQSMPAV